MAETFPITPEMVVEAYMRTGLTPGESVWPSRDNTGKIVAADAISTMYADRFGIKKLDRFLIANPYEEMVQRIAKDFRIEPGDLISFVGGYFNVDYFDNKKGNPSRKAAYLAGRRSAQLMGLIPADADGQEVGR